MHRSSTSPSPRRPTTLPRPVRRRVPFRRHRAPTDGPCVSAAVKHMASSLAVEWAKKGVRVNCLRYVPSPRCVIRAKPVPTPRSAPQPRLHAHEAHAHDPRARHGAQGAPPPPPRARSLPLTSVCPLPPPTENLGEPHAYGPHGRPGGPLGACLLPLWCPAVLTACYACVQGAIVFLASDASRFMTGSEIRVDGGYCCV